jgi:hypothetical protein
MIKLKKLLTESNESSDLWDDWYQYIDYESYAIDKEEITKLITRFKLHGKKYLNGALVKIWDDKHEAWLEFDGKTLDHISDIGQWMYDLNESSYHKYGIDPEAIYNSFVESSLQDFKTNPGKVYHWTTEEKWEKIQKSGKLIGSYGTGINNRSAHGIFTSTDPQEYALGSYGNICLEIDLERYLKDSGKAEVFLEWEPGVEEYLVREYLMHVLEIEDRHNEIDNDGGISPYTVIVRETIPLQYVRQI